MCSLAQRLSDSRRLEAFPPVSVSQSLRPPPSPGGQRPARLNDRTALLRAHRQGKRGPKIAKAEREQWRAEAGHCLFQKAEGSKGRSVETWGGLAGPLRALRSVFSSQEGTGWVGPKRRRLGQGLGAGLLSTELLLSSSRRFWWVPQPLPSPPQRALHWRRVSTVSSGTLGVKESERYLGGLLTLVGAHAGHLLGSATSLFHPSEYPRRKGLVRSRPGN